MVAYLLSFILERLLNLRFLKKFQRQSFCASPEAKGEDKARSDMNECRPRRGQAMNEQEPVGVRQKLDRYMPGRGCRGHRSCCRSEGFRGMVAVVAITVGWGLREGRGGKAVRGSARQPQRVDADEEDEQGRLRRKKQQELLDVDLMARKEVTCTNRFFQVV